MSTMFAAGLTLPVQNMATGQSLSMSFFALLIVLATMTVTLALHTILAEE